MDRFNYHMLNLARDARGLTQAELSRAAGMGQPILSKYETGQSEPSQSAVTQLASALSYPESFFFEPGRPYGFPPYHFRKRKKLGIKPLNRISAEMNIRRMHVQKLIVSYELKARTPLPEIDPDEYRGPSAKQFDVEDIARTVREAWMLPPGPISSVSELVENAGGIVIHCDFGTDLIDGMSQRIDGLPVLFFMNTNVPGDRYRYSLAHEIGHMILHTLSVKPDDEMEAEADRFAGALLLPADELRPQLRQFNMRHLANLKAHWRVSMGAIAMRAEKLRYITPYQSKNFWIEMSREGYRKREPIEVPLEQPRTLRDMIQFHRESLGYSEDEMAGLLHLKRSEYVAMYEVARSAPENKATHLRLVKS